MGSVRTILFILFSINLVSCIKETKVPLRTEKPILVVEGSVTNDSLPYNIRLSYSGPLESGVNIPDQYLEKEAIVKITDDNGKTANLVHKGQGLYETTDTTFIGTPGRAYTVTIVLKNGKTYVSTPEKMPAAVPINNIEVDYNERFSYLVPTTLDVSIGLTDPASVENYYRWSFYSYTMRKTAGISCGFGCVYLEYCYQKIVDTSFRILSDASVNGNEIRKFPVGKSYVYWYGDHFIDISQQSLTRQAFQFWRSYKEQLTRTGSLVDPLPASIKGNVFNQADENDFALGYFSAVSVTHKRAVLIPFGITQYIIDRTAQQFVPVQSAICYEYFANTLRYPPPPAKQYPDPPGWEKAERIEVRW